MNVKIPEKGMVALSLQGRDKGAFYVVSEVVGGGKVALADGKKRTVASPKIKNSKHLRLFPRNVSEYGVTWPWDKATDNRIARYLKEFRAADKDISEE